MKTPIFEEAIAAVKKSTLTDVQICEQYKKIKKALADEVIVTDHPATSPALQCSTCRAIRPHRFLIRRNYKTDPARPTSTRFDIWTCNVCGMERIWGAV